MRLSRNDIRLHAADAEFPKRTVRAPDGLVQGLAHVVIFTSSESKYGVMTHRETVAAIQPDGKPPGDRYVEIRPYPGMNRFSGSSVVMRH